MAQTVKVEQRGRVLLARLDNPPHNFLTASMVAELDLLVRRADSDPGVGAVILTGEHPDAFITHYDVADILAGSERFEYPLPPRLAGWGLRTVGALGRVPGARAALRRTPASGVLDMCRIHDVFRRMNRARAVFVAAINGAATGGGCELTLACDLRIISSSGGPIGQPEMLLGLTPGGGSTQRLVRMLGQARAVELILEGRLLDPAEAADLGLVHRVVPAERLLTEALDTAERLARRRPKSIALAKRAVYEGASKSREAGLHFERSAYLSTTVSPAAIGAMRAYVGAAEEQGSPDFTDPERLRPWSDGTAVDLNA